MYCTLYFVFKAHAYTVARFRCVLMLFVDCLIKPGHEPGSQQHWCLSLSKHFDNGDYNERGGLGLFVH